MSGTKMIVLKSSNGESFEVEESVTMESLTIKKIIKEGCVDNIIPLPSVSGPILAKVIEFCDRHAKASEGGTDGDLKAFDDEFVRVDRITLFDMIKAAHYLNINSLLDLGCKTVANMMKGRRIEEIREMFNIINDFTPEEEEKVKMEVAFMQFLYGFRV